MSIRCGRGVDMLEPRKKSLRIFNVDKWADSGVTCKKDLREVM